MPFKATRTRYSLVKGERIVRFVLEAWLRKLLMNQLLCFINEKLLVLAPSADVGQKFLHLKDFSYISSTANLEKHSLAYSKAYDRVNWGFLEFALREIKLPRATIKIIMQCVITVHFQLNLNGEATPSFALERGRKQEISSICESPLTSNLGKYLGVPLIHTRLTKATYRSVVDKVQQKLTAWKGKLLSLPGGATLIQSVTASIPLYTMQTVRLPTSTCELDKINRNFLWGSSDDVSKAHLGKWDTVCKSKKKGGLGLKQTDLMNQSMLAKVGWRLLQYKESLWSNALIQKYLQDLEKLKEDLPLEMVAMQLCLNLTQRSRYTCLTKNVEDLHPLAAMLWGCQDYINKYWVCFIHHVYRECNMVADKLAELDSCLKLGLSTFYDPPDSIRSFLSEDLLGVYRPRAIV
ncbi:hypothetical protein L3X38_012402 [Prunus dulcis]|uniref:RNase H type-1 domain-containing protein n=1 Tax=Prunus dulcis TaxID=3755 RepID=A0AAD4WJ98_PRUDU|nr:hypothetical protein L3X38_012402 [Prunus dulcis]